ncbi:MAG: hypothetical protein ACM3MK_05090, partial [Chitinophagales bacterium]
MTADQVIKELDALGVNIQSERTLQRYVKERLIPVPNRKSAGRGLGKLTDYQSETPAELYASYKLKHEHKLKSDQIARCREKGLLMEEKNEGLGFADWFFGVDVTPELYFEAGYGQTWLIEKHRVLSNHDYRSCQV